ncbi:putative T7SS-secreted protein, partial [Mesorhizobium japonicum]|uniref:putative T7SS-secreted protein n=1 Tax=Mesorhizobium japonicum TaxID=2066070 RepID=UPI003B595D27
MFRSETARMPGELTKADDSYSMVAVALSGWAAAVEDAQAQADRGLALARDAHTDLLSAQSAYDHAHTSWSVAHAQQLTQQRLQKQYQDVPPPWGVTVPTDAQLRATTRTVLQARTSMDAAQSQIASATARLDAARRLVLEAKAARDDAERRTVAQISAATTHAVKPSSVWEAIQDSAEWQAIVVIATVVLTIVSIVAFIVGGPIVWAI